MPPIKLPPAATTFALALAGLLGVSLSLWLVYPRISGVEHLAGGARSGPVTLPWSFTEVGDGNRLDLALRVTWATPRRWHIVADDHLTSLRINGQPVPLEDVPPAALSDWQNGFDLDLGRWLHSGDNRIQLAVDNQDGPGGITLRPLPGWRNLLFVAGLLPWLVALARIFRLRAFQTALLGGAIGVLCCYWAATPWFQRAYDVKRLGEGGHIDYVIYVAEHASLPPPDEGWQYYQPPLYYVGGALTWRWAKWLSLPGPETLQAYSLALWLVFLTASVATLKLTLRRSPWALGLATAALALWPSSVLNAPRIGNDAALYAAAAVSTWFLVRWWRGGRSVHLAGASLSIAAAFLCKNTAIVLLAAAGTLILVHMLRRARWRKRRPWIEVSAAIAVMLAGFALTTSRNVPYWRHGTFASLLVCNIGGLDANLRVPNDLGSYIPLDAATFLANPWISSRDDTTGRKNFWNYLLRSSLTGEFAFDGAARQAVAILWGALVLWLVVLLLLRLRWARPSLTALWREAPWAAVSLFWIASIVSSRVTYPFSCMADFRYILPALVPFVWACARGGRLSRVLLAVTALSSAAFFVTL
jgi:hypothetical protein